MAKCTFQITLWLKRVAQIASDTYWKIVQTCCWNEIRVTFHFEHLVAFAASVSVSLANVFLVKLASLDRGVIIKIMTSGGLPATVAASSRVFLNGLFPQRRLPTVGWASSLEENFKACISDNTLKKRQNERLKKPTVVQEVSGFKIKIGRSVY